MKSFDCVGVEIPILYINPPYNADSRIMCRVSQAGGLGIVDHVTAGPARFTVPAHTPHGVRLGLEALHDRSWQPDEKLAVLPLENWEVVSTLASQSLNGIPVPVFVEVGNRRQAVAAINAGASGLIARGNEGPGWVSETSGLVLLQEIIDLSELPVFLQGGISPRTARAAIAAGAAGVVLDVHFTLAEESRLPENLKGFLSSLSFPTTTLLAEGRATALRVYSRIGTRMVRELRKIEETLSDDERDAYEERLSMALTAPCANPDSDEALLPLSEDLATAAKLAREYGDTRSIVQAFSKTMAELEGPWPFTEDSPTARDHGTRFPLVQGPMANVSDNPEFLRAVASAGALPFLAMGNMPRPIAEEALALASEKTRGRFGVGLIGLEVNRACYEAHLESMKKNPPPYAILAAGGPELARRIEDNGTACYLHCPAPSMLSEGLKVGLRRFVFEGCESGGHIGTLSSLNLWSANLDELQEASRNGLDLKEVTVLFAGGIASSRAAAFVAGLVSDLPGLKVGLQMGTAYLATAEAVSTCAITPTYQQLTLESDRTVVIGRTVNTRARAAGSPMASKLIDRELDRIKSGISLRERKEQYEKDNLGALRLASKGCAIDPSTATFDCPVFCDLPPEEQLQRGLYLMGQVVSVLDRVEKIEDLHARIIEGGRAVFEASTRPRETAQKVEEKILPGAGASAEVEMQREPIAVVGIGVRLPGSNSVAGFWQQILEGRSGIVEVPEDRWENKALYYDPDPKAPDKSYSCIGGFVQDFTFDPLKYRIPPAVAKKMDRTQQMAVTCVADALADAGLSPDELKGRRVGIILGNSMGGETTDKYAARVLFPRTLTCLQSVLEDANVDEQTRARLLEEYRARYLEHLPDITEDSLPGELANVISGRVANVFNLEGPNFTVDAACASSMAAVMNAVNALREGRIDFAITGGVDAAMGPASFVKFCKIGALSPDGSRPFDEGANGFVMGEGAGVLILKRLSDAVRDNDRIYATIIEVGSSSDGRGKGITAPNAAGQERAVRACYDAAGIDPTTVGLIEAHGTSTPVGDRTELATLDGFFRSFGAAPGSVGIGSVKSQIGHLKAAAGAAGIVKAALALYHRILPPTINVTRPNSCIQWETSPLALLVEPRPWNTPPGIPRRAGASAFGFGGTNFHVLLQEHVPGLRVVPGRKKEESPVVFNRPPWPKPPTMAVEGELWLLAASDTADLEAKAKGLMEELSNGRVASLARDYGRIPPHSTVRVGFAAADAEDARKKLSLLLDAMSHPEKKAALRARGIHISEGSKTNAQAGVALLFPGQGSQYPYMLRDLAERFPVVAQTFEEADKILVSLGLPSATSITFPTQEEAANAQSAKADPMRDTQILQPLILTADTAIFRLLQQIGIKPTAVAGHSLGEYAACVAAGVFSFRDALEAVAVRGREMSKVSIADPGLMMSIPADARLVEEVLAQVDGYVVAANKNSPKQTVISGQTHAVKKAGELFAARGLEGVLLPVSAAFHSGVVAPAREPFMRTLEKLTVNPPTIPVLSNVTGDFYPVGPAAPSKIRDLLGKQFAAPVEWVKSLRKMYSEGIRIFVECGPKRVMTNLTIDTLPADVLALPTNHPKKGGVAQFLEAAAALAAEGLPIDFSSAELLENTGKLTAPRQPVPLTVVPERPQPQPPVPTQSIATHPLEQLLDDELREIAAKAEFTRFLEFQADPIRDLVKSGFKSWVKKVLPLERTVKHVESEGMNFKPVVFSGVSAGLPSDERFPFDHEVLDDLLLGRNFIKRVPDDARLEMLEKNVERLLKGPKGEVEIQAVEDTSGVIKLAGFFSEEEIIEQYGIDERLVRAMDVTTRLAVAAGIEALRDAGIPLLLQKRTTSIGHELPDSWALPPSMRKETGVIFASAFPGMASLADEVARGTASRYGSGAKRRLIDFYTGLLERIRDDRERERITKWFTQEFSRLSPDNPDEIYSFNRDFLLRVMSGGQGQIAQLIKAQGPNTHVDAACASTTQAILMARDWIRTGQAKRVLVVAADDVAGKTLLPWIGSGFLAMGAATTTGNVTEAALPFDDRRHGLILGSAAVGFVLERQDLVEQRGMEPIASIEVGLTANSGFHGTRLDVEHIARTMEELVEKWERQTGRSRSDLAKDLLFMSHETYSPKRGGSSAAEVRALRKSFGDNATRIPIANSKGYTGHTMGVGVEDVLALRCLQKRMLPPIPNLKQPDPEFSDMNLSRGGPCDASHVLRLAAGFGSQIVMALYRIISREENRIADLGAHRNWLQEVTSYPDPVVFVENRTLKVREREERRDTEAPAATAHRGNGTVPSERSAQGQGAEQVRSAILALLANKTGYPPDMLDTGLDLEADLGIDTVKQAEFISEVREKFGIPRIEGLKIADFPTIEHIIGFVRQHTERAEPASYEVISTVPLGAQAVSGEEVREKILSLLSRKTGYPADMLDTGLDLEADLGIDTVKQAEFISEVREAFQIPRIEGLKIADFPTIEHIVGFVLERTQSTGNQAEPVPTVAVDSQSSSSDVRERILGLLAGKTGYPVDMLDPELDLEADLGIDTVKQAEFITEVREMFGIPRIEGLKIADFPTINDIIAFVEEKIQSQTEQEQPAEQEHTGPSPQITADEVRMFEARLVMLPDSAAISPPEVDLVLVAGGSDNLVEEVERSLAALGYPAILRCSAGSLPENLPTRVGIVNLLPMDIDPAAVRSTLELYLSLARTYEQGPAFLVTAVSEDGAYGFEDPQPLGYLAGEISGATKSFAREYPECRIRMLDLHPDMDDGTRGKTIVRSLVEAWPLETAVASDGARRAVRLVPDIEKLPEVGVEAGDVVLVSGGGGGITAACIRHLAEHQSSLTFAILDLTPISNRAEQLASFGDREWEQEKHRIIERFKRDGKAPTPVTVNRELGRLRAEADAFRNVQKLRSLGAEVIYRSVDIRDGQAVAHAVQEVAEICRRVDVVIHAAGIDISRALRSKTLEEIERVISVKVEGMRRLLEALQESQLLPRRIVGFGSVSGRFGNLAQIDYSAANNGLAHLLRWADNVMGTRASVIDWAPWSEIGMAVRGSVQQTLESAGIDFVTPQKGVQFLARELGRYTGSREFMAAGRLGPFAVDAFEGIESGVPFARSVAGQSSEVVALVPGHYVKVKVALSPSHPLLNDHRIDRAAVLPGVGGMEIMRASAALIDPGAVDGSFEDVKFHSPLKIFKDQPFEADVEIVRMDTTNERTRYLGRISSWFVNPVGQRVGSPRLHHECKIVVGAADRTEPIKLDRWDRSVWIGDRDIYKIFFHGPGFQFLDSVLLQGDGPGVRFRYHDTEHRSSMFADMVPGSIEAAFQAAAAFGIESRGIMTLPVGIGKAVVHQRSSIPMEGELSLNRVDNSEGTEGRTILVFDGVVKDFAGDVIISLHGVEMMELTSTEGFPGRIFEEIVSVNEVADCLEQDRSTFIAENMTEEEARLLSEKVVPKRAAEWAAGRAAVRKCLERLLATAGSSHLGGEIRIVQDEQGKPIAELSGQPGIQIGEVSLSHSNGIAMAMAGLPGEFRGIGVDVEKIESRSEAWAGDYFSEEEIVSAGNGDRRWAQLTRMWCLKEAALKALGIGLRFDLKDIRVASLDSSGRAVLEFRNEVARYMEKLGWHGMEARVDERDGLAVARVLFRN